MELTFTDYVRALAPRGKPPNDEPPNDELPEDVFNTVWEKLRNVLWSEMFKRCLWSQPPRYLGIYGWPDWRNREAMDELIADCYQYIFIDRLAGLQGHLMGETGKKNIEGLVFLCVRHFLYDRQTKFDPLGSNIFKALRMAVNRLVEPPDQTCYILGEDVVRVRYGTIIGFSPMSDSELAEAVDSSRLAELVEAWVDDLLPELVTAQGRVRQKVIARLEDRLSRLPDSGIEVFRFKDIAVPFKCVARERWCAVWRGEEGEKGFETEGDHPVFVRLAHPSFTFEERESFQALLKCMEQAIDRFGASEKTRGYLWKLWNFLRSHAVEEPSAYTPGDLSTDKLPSRRKIAKILGIPRDRLSELFQVLRQLIEKCRGAR